MRATRRLGGDDFRVILFADGHARARHRGLCRPPALGSGLGCVVGAWASSHESLRLHLPPPRSIVHQSVHDAWSLKMKSSVGSDAFALLALAFISVFVLLLLRHFLPLRTTPAYLIVPVFLALALPISIFLLVPIDLASSSGIPDGTSSGIWLPKGVLLVAWRVAYWLTFALTWWVNAFVNSRNKLIHLIGSYSPCLANMSTQAIDHLKTDSYTLCA